MKKDQAKTEKANIKINEAFAGEERDGPDLSNMVGENQIALVTSGKRKNKFSLKPEDIEDM